MYTIQCTAHTLCTMYTAQEAKKKNLVKKLIYVVGFEPTTSQRCSNVANHSSSIPSLDLAAFFRSSLSPENVGSHQLHRPSVSVSMLHHAPRENRSERVAMITKKTITFDRNSHGELLLEPAAALLRLPS